MTFRDREDAGRKLAAILWHHRGKPDTIVVALPRGGVVLGRIVADELGVPLDLVVPRKIAAPENDEYAIGAITETGEAVWNPGEMPRVNKAYLAGEIKKEIDEAARRLKLYRKGMPPRDLKGKTVIVVDDGIATGFTMLAAVRTIKKERPKKIVVAVPVAPADADAALQSEADEIVILFTPPSFGAIGAFYETFPQVDDQAVASLMKQ